MSDEEKSVPFLFILSQRRHKELYVLFSGERLEEVVVSFLWQLPASNKLRLSIGESKDFIDKQTVVENEISTEVF